MTQMVFTVAELAKKFGVSYEQLLKDLSACGIDKQDRDSTLTEQECQAFKNFRTNEKNATPLDLQKTIQAKRRMLLQVGSGNKQNTVKVEIRKKRVYLPPVDKKTAPLDSARDMLVDQKGHHEPTNPIGTSASVIEIVNPGEASGEAKNLNPSLKAACAFSSGLDASARSTTSDACTQKIATEQLPRQNDDIATRSLNAEVPISHPLMLSTTENYSVLGSQSHSEMMQIKLDDPAVQSAPLMTACVSEHSKAATAKIQRSEKANQRPVAQTGAQDAASHSFNTAIALEGKGSSLGSKKARAVVMPSPAANATPRQSVSESEKERAGRLDRHPRKKSRASEANLKAFAKRLVVDPNLDSDSLDDVISEAFTQAKVGPVGGGDRRASQKMAVVPVSKAPHGKAQRLEKLSAISAGERLQQRFHKPVTPVRRNVQIRPGMTVAEIAEAMSVKSSEVLKCLIKLGCFLGVNASLEPDVAEWVVEQFGHTTTLLQASQYDLSDLSPDSIPATAEHTPQKELITRTRAPVVVVIGHVDHGKTSLLDYIRRSELARKEVGGITQHLGAYPVSLPGGEIIFLDTPGHSAFSQMRARGAQITDIAILVIAADDGIMPQTVEAIQHLKAANVPLVVAVTKMDKAPRADILDVIEQQLLQYEVVSEKLGGQTPILGISSKTGLGIQELLETLLLQAEFMGLTTVVDTAASGIVLESRLDKGRGIATTLLLQHGTLRKGDILICGLAQGKVRILETVFGESLEVAEPTLPLLIYGLDQLPQPGDRLTVIESEKKAKFVTKKRQSQVRTQRLEVAKQAHLEHWMRHATNVTSQDAAQTSERKILNVVIKSDVQGTLEAIKHLLPSLETPEATIMLRGYGVGNFNESDLLLAAASQASLVGFNVGCDPNAKSLLEKYKLDLKNYRVIYDLADALRAQLQSLITPVVTQKRIGIAQVRALFKSERFGVIAGCFIQEGKALRHAVTKLLRNGEPYATTEVESLRKGKENVAEVTQGLECGVGLKQGKEIAINDYLEFYEEITLDGRV